MISHALTFFAGTLAGVLIMSIVAVSGEDTPSRTQGPQTPPVDPNDPNIEVHGI